VPDATLDRRSVVADDEELLSKFVVSGAIYYDGVGHHLIGATAIAR
jgi:hypothetical protein